MDARALVALRLAALASFPSGTVSWNFTVSNTNPVHSMDLLAPQVHILLLMSSPYLSRSSLTTPLAHTAFCLEEQQEKPSSM